MQIRIAAAQVEVLAEADVVVCGGGGAGVTAAVAAARHGASVVLVERWPTLGGMATNALVNGWHRSDREKMVVYCRTAASFPSLTKAMPSIISVLPRMARSGTCCPWPAIRWTRRNSRA